MTAKPYVIELTSTLRARILVFAESLDQAHENMHELADGYFTELHEITALDSGATSPSEIMEIRPALHEEASSLHVGTLTTPGDGNFFTEDERQVIAYMSEDEGDEG